LTTPQDIQEALQPCRVCNKQPQVMKYPNPKPFIGMTGVASPQRPSVSIQCHRHDNVLVSVIAYGDTIEQAVVDGISSWNGVQSHAQEAIPVDAVDLEKLKDQTLYAIQDKCGAHFILHPDGTIELHPEEIVYAVIDHLAPQLARAVPEWMPIETAPKDRLIFIINMNRENPPVFVAYHSEAHSSFRRGPRFKEDAGFYNIEATHWMPIPAAPQQKKGE